MATTQETVDIDAPADRVWAVMSDVARWPDWTPTVDTVIAQGEASLKPGAVFRVRQPRLPTTTWTVTEVVPGRQFAWTSSSPGVRSRGDHRVEPIGDRSRAVLTFEQTGFLAPLSGLFLSGLIRRYVRTEGASLKAFAERDPGGRP